MIVRELLLFLGFKLDEAGAQKAKESMLSLKNVAATIGQGLAFGKVFGFLKNAADSANAAGSTMSMLQLTFGDSTTAVTDWASSFAKATGASQYRLREMAGEFGTMLGPALNFDQAKTAEMSTALSGLAMDLAAVNSQDPKAVMGDLMSAMRGRAEGVARLGIRLDDAALAEFAHSKGIHKKVDDMTAAQKTELIYAKILKDTRKQTGAAARDSDSYGGALMRLDSAWTDLDISVGQFVEGPGAQLISWLAKGVNWITEWTTHSEKMEAAAIVLGAVMAGLAVSMAIANWPILAAAAALMVLYLLVEDIVVMFKGGESAMGRWLDTLGGLGTKEAVVKGFTEAWDVLKKTLGDPAFYQSTIALMKGLWNGIKAIFDLARALGTVIGASAGWIASIAPNLGDMLAKDPKRRENFARRFQEANAAFSRDNQSYQPTSDWLTAEPAAPAAGSSAVSAPVTINLYGNVTPAQAELASKTATDVVNNSWWGASETTNTARTVNRR